MTQTGAVVFKVNFTEKKKTKHNKGIDTEF